VAIAITARSGGLFRLDTKKNDPHPSAAIPFIFPGFVLMLRVITDMHFLQWKSVLYVSLALACVLGYAALIADRSLRSRRANAVLIFVLGITYGMGAGMETNALLDRSKPTIYPAGVTDKRTISGRHTTYNLYLAPWGPKKDTDEVSVSRRFYDSVQTGDPVCIVLHDGAMKVPWYTVHHCSR
jgi:hypothetical protein